MSGRRRRRAIVHPTFSAEQLRPSTGLPVENNSRERSIAAAEAVASSKSIYLQHAAHRALFASFDYIRAVDRLSTGARSAMRVIGASSSGKSTAFDQYIEIDRRRSEPPPGHLPIFRVKLDRACTTKRLVTSMLDCYGDEYSDASVESTLRKRLYRCVEVFGTELVFVDEVQHLGFRSSERSDPTDTWVAWSISSGRPSRSQCGAPHRASSRTTCGSRPSDGRSSRRSSPTILSARGRSMTDRTRWTRPEPGSGRVLFPPEADPLEYLMGLVLKAASDNVHMNVGAILAAAGYPHARSFDLALSRLGSLDRLAEVLGIDHAVLKGLAFTTVHSTKALTTVRFLGGKASSFDVVTRRRRVSGETLRSQPFHRAVWTHGLLPYCPASLELLVDRCPGCGDPLDWYRATLAGEPERRLVDVNAIFRCAEPDCGLDLRELPSPKLGEKPWGAIVGALLNGALPFRLHVDVRRVFRGIVVAPASVDLLRSFSFERANHPDFRFERDMSRRDVEEALNLVPGTLQAALDQELGPDRSRGRILVADVEDIARRMISAAEISARTWPGTRRLPRAVTRSRHQRLGAAGWLRQDVEPLLDTGS